MRFGRKCPDGWLPIYSVDTEDEARRLIAAACIRGLDGEYYAPELAEDQTLDNLYAFGERLDKLYKKVKKG